MQIKKVTKTEITLTKEDLRVMALACLKIGGSDRKISAIKALRDMTKVMRIVGDNGEPMMVKMGPCPTCMKWECDRAQMGRALVPTLAMCKDAVDSWFDGKEFLG
jgi:hypothetical protein